MSPPGPGPTTAERAPVEVRVLGPVEVLVAGRPRELSRGWRATLGLLAANPGVIDRDELAAACGLAGGQAHRKLLSTLAHEGLGLPPGRRVHVADRRVPGAIAADRAVLDSDVFRLEELLAATGPGLDPDLDPAASDGADPDRAGADRADLAAALALLRGPTLAGIDWVRDPALDAAVARVEALRNELLRRVGRSDLARLGHDGWLIGGLDPGAAGPAETHPPELWLARLARATLDGGASGAADLIDTPPAGHPRAGTAGRLSAVLLGRVLAGALLAERAGDPSPGPRSSAMRGAVDEVRRHLGTGGPSVVLVVGPAGIGKTHLLADVAHEAGPLPVVRAQAFSDRGAADVLAQIAAAPALALTRRLDPGLSPHLKSLADVLWPSGGEEGREADRSGAATRAPHDERTVRDVARVLDLAFPDGAVVMIDDIHHHRAPLERLIAELAVLTGEGVRIVASRRDDGASIPTSSEVLAAVDRVEVIRIGQIGPEDVVLLRTDAGATPASAIDEVLRRAEGRPAGVVFDSTSDPDAGLEDHVRQVVAARPVREQRALAALALAATDDVIDADLGSVLLRELDLDWGAVDVADDRVPIVVRSGDLDPHFRHALWADAASGVLLAHERRHLHHVAFEHLHERRTSRAGDLTVIADHALAAVGPLALDEVVAVVLDAVRQARALRDHDVCRRLIDRTLDLRPPEHHRIELLERRAAANRLLGRWDDARRDYAVVIEAALGADDRRRAARLVLDMADATWDPGTSREVATLIHRVRELFADDTEVAARLDLCLAGGLDQDGTAGANRIGHERLRVALDLVSARSSGTAQARSLIHARQALLDVIGPEESHDLARRVAAAADTEDVRAHAWHIVFVDQLRLDDRAGAAATLRHLTEMARTPASANQAVNALICAICWDLAIGRFDRAARSMARMRMRFDAAIGGDTLDQIHLAHAFWLAREQGGRDELRSYRDGAAALHDQDPTTPLWAAAEALLSADLGEHDRAYATLERVAKDPGLDALPRGPHRVATLALLSEVAAVVRHHVTIDGELAPALYRQLVDDPHRGVLAGWPAVFIGPIERYRGLAAAACGHRDLAAGHLDAAIVADRHFRPQLLRSVGAAVREVGHGPDSPLGRRLRRLEVWMAHAGRSLREGGPDAAGEGPG
ncbi:MAG: ATP-binding protein [Actinomycetota bacterium]|nr:ATP-binding protein [Actinomycetota bacterium]